MIEAAAASAAAAFADEPSLAYSLPDPSKRANMARIFSYYMNLDLWSGSDMFVTSPRCEGIAVWQNQNVKSSWLLQLRAGLLTLPYYAGWHFVRYERKEEKFYQALKNKHAPRRHLYLALLAVAPPYQGKGYAGRLLRPVTAYLDRHDLPCYLETQNMPNVNMYRRYGFELLESTHYPPGTECEVHVMLRKPTVSKLA